MKKILLATTALTLTAGMAAAEVSVSAAGNVGMKYAETTDKSSELKTHTEVAFTVQGSTTLDNGLTLGAKTTQLTSNDGTTGNDGTNVYVKGAFGTLTFGDVAEADEIAALPDLGFDGIGTDDVAEVYSGDTQSKKEHNVHFGGSMGGLSYAISARLGDNTAAVDAVAADAKADPIVVGSAAVAAANNESYAIGAKYTVDNFYVGVGYNSTDIGKGSTTAKDGASTSFYAGGSFDALSVAAMTTTFNSEKSGVKNVDAFGVVATYDLGATKVSVAYSDNDAAREAYGIGFTHNLGGGATLAGAVGQIGTANGAAKKSTAKADLGINFKF